MRAAQLVAPGRIECVEAPVPVPGPDEVLIRTLRTTVCGSDLHITRGEMSPPAYPCPAGFPGHESVGVLDGRPVLAVPRPASAGAFAEYQVLPRTHCLPLPDDADARGLVLAQQLGTVLCALRRFWPHAEPGRCAVVLGAGPAGLFFVQRLRALGFSTVVVADPIPGRRARALALGADVAVDPGEVGEGAADLVIEAAGRDAARAAAADLVADGGRIGLFGLPERRAAVAFPLHTLFARRATLVAGAGAQEEPGLRSFREAIELLACDAIEGRSFVTHQRGVERVGEALGMAAEPGDDVLKVAIEFERG